MEALIGPLCGIALVVIIIRMVLRGATRVVKGEAARIDAKAKADAGQP